MRVAILGAGSLGCAIGGVLTEAGHEVWLINRNASLVEASVELCDGRPSMVDGNLTYWLGTVRSFCPWASFVYSEDD